MSIEFNADNAKLLEALKQFPQNIQKNILVGAVRAGTKPLVDAARANVPVDEGILKKSIGTVKQKTKDKSMVHFSVAPLTKKIHLLQDRRNEKHYNYGNIVEVGREGNNWAKKEFGTSTSAAQPLMRPAFESQDRQSIEAVKEYMAERIDKEIEKARR